MNSFEWSWALAKVKVLWFGDFVFLQNFIFYFFLHGCYCDHCISRSSRSAGAMLRCWVICPKTPRSLWWSCKPVFSLTSATLQPSLIFPWLLPPRLFMIVLFLCTHAWSDKLYRGFFLLFFVFSPKGRGALPFFWLSCCSVGLQTFYLFLLRMLLGCSAALAHGL